LVVALDYPAAEPALDLVDRLGETVRCYKVGLELFTRAGPGVVKMIRSEGRSVFLDLKLHDIPNTVAGATRAAADLEVRYLTIHAAGGARMIEAARQQVEGTSTRLLAVTVLTSHAPGELAGLRGGEAVAVGEAVRLAVLALESGAHGVVASAGEVAAIRARVGADAVIASPGIRLGDEPRDDQRRVFGPGEAVRAGTDLLVVGRPITRAADPLLAVRRIVSEMRPEMTQA
jgi:orotidine-5'-phosphate decarboxylase